MWKDQIEEFSQYYKVITYDMRGYGKSTPVNGIFNHSNDLLGLLNHLNVQSAHFVGCSKGGGVLIDFALSNPELVKSITLVSTFPHGYDDENEPDPPKEWQLAIDSFNNNDLEKTSEIECKIWVIGRYRQKNEVSEKIFTSIKQMNLIVLKNEKDFTMKEEITNPKAFDMLKENKHLFPILFILGTLDDPLINTNAIKVAEIIAAPIVSIDNTAHLPNMEKPTEFNSELRNFLRNIDN